MPAISNVFAHLLSHSASTTVHGFPGYAEDDPVPSLLQVLDGLAPANTAQAAVWLASDASVHDWDDALCRRGYALIPLFGDGI